MSKERLYLFDTTLRDGAQTAGIEFSLEDKIARRARCSSRSGVDYVEGGYPGANVVDDAFFAEPRTKRATFTAFGMTKRSGRSVGNDPGVQAILNSSASAACFVGKAWDHQVKVALGITPEENLKNLGETIKASVAAGKETLIDCEHFFDGYKANPAYALSFVETAHRRRRALGRAVRHQWRHHAGRSRRRSCARSCTVAPGDKLGIHAHDDTGQAVANSLAAVRRRRAPGPGNAQRHRRAVRQCQPRDAHPDAAAEAGFRRSLRDRRQHRPARRIDPHLARLRRSAQSRARSGRRPMSAPPPSPPRPASTPRRWPRTRRATSTCRPRASAMSATSWSASRPANPTC